MLVLNVVKRRVAEEENYITEIIPRQVKLKTDGPKI